MKNKGVSKIELSKYTVCFESNENCLLVNLNNGIAVKVNNCDYSKIKNKQFEKISEDAQHVLIKYNFLLNHSENNFELDFDKYVAMNINLTSGCNFACDYCYFRANNKEKQKISLDEKEFIHWFKVYIAPQRKHIFMNFLGGEPLLELGKLLDISNEIKKYADKYSVNYFGEVTTNGYFLSKKESKLLVGSGIKSIQVTLDGDKEEHDKIRSCAGNGTYDIILDNLCACKQIIPITVRININKKTRITAIKNLLEDLKNKEIENMYFSTIEDNFIDETNSSEENDLVMTDEEALYKYIEVWKLQHDFGFKFIQKIPAILGNCIAQNPNGYTVNYDGKMYFCPTTCGISEFRTNNLYDYNNDKGKIIVENSSNCIDCNLYPICMGGCKVLNRISDSKKNCRKKFIYQMLLNYYSIKYQLNLTENKINLK